MLCYLPNPYWKNTICVCYTWGCCCWGAGGALASIWFMKGTAPICWGRKGWPIICICPERGWKDTFIHLMWWLVPNYGFSHGKNIQYLQVNQKESNVPGQVSGGLTEGTSSVAAYLVAHFCVENRRLQAYTSIDKTYVKLWKDYSLQNYSLRKSITTYTGMAEATSSFTSSAGSGSSS